MTKKIRVLEIINDATIGGGQTHIIQILKHIDKEIFELFVACSPKGSLLDEFSRYSTKCIQVGISKKLNLVTLFRFYKIIQKYHIEIVHTHGGIAGLWGRLAAIFSKRPVVHSLHGIHYLYYENLILKKLFILLEKFLSKFTDITICVAESDREKGIRHKLFKSNECIVIRNGIDIRTFAPEETHIPSLKKLLGIEEDVKLIGHVARLHRQKGQAYLLQAFKEVNNKYPNSKLLLLGGGPMKKTLEQLSSDLDLNNHVYFLGLRKDVRNILAIVDVFVLSSLWEGLPIALLEAMAMGKPIVSTNVDGIKEIVENQKEGILVPPRNPELLAEALITLLQDNALAMKLGRQAQQKMVSEFNVERMVKEIEKVYSSLI